MSKRIIIINGPNLNLLGKREPEIYGNQDFETYFSLLSKVYAEVRLEYYHSNVEGELINKLHEVGFSHYAIILNPGGYTHTSVALGDAIAAIQTPVIEVHISNLYRREEFRHVSYTAAHCAGVISGFGLNGYELALEYAVTMLGTT
ncbi:MAG: type II 3-dehydroquinate dehydratase [Flavobacteriales bacterium]|jgi:3-dehydroquinate dehydratase-2